MLHACLLLLLACVSAQAGYIGHSDIASGVHAAGLLGSYAGGLSGGQALSALSEHAKFDHEADSEVHDFSLDAQELSAAPEAHELGHLAEQLSEHSFPNDFSSSAAGEEYAEAAASEHHEQHFDALQLLDEHHDEHQLELEHDFEDSKPVPGIDHGKGAFSYSTLYEFKDDEHELH